MQIIKLSLILLVCLPFVETAGAVATQRYSDRTDVREFIETISTRHRLNRAELMRLFRDVQVQDKALTAISRPAETVWTWAKYRSHFINDARISGGVKFWKKWRKTLAKAEKEFGVPAQVIVAIVGAEANYGSITGKYPVLDTLATLGFDYPPRGKFFRSELEQFLLLVREERIDPMLVKGSYAAAMGMPQFISSSYRRYSVDYDGDGRRNLWNSPEDVIGSVANYFNKKGWQSGEWVAVPVKVAGDLSKAAAGKGRQKLKPKKTVKEFSAMGVRFKNKLPQEALATLLLFDAEHGDEYWLGGQNFYVITRYNISSMYAMAVFQLSQAIKKQYEGSNGQ